MQSRTENRRQAMLDAATALFIEKGYRHTTLCDILNRSKGSRSTLYKLFGNKEGLLEAMIKETTDHVWQSVESWSTASEPLDEDTLTDLGCRFVKAILGPRAIATHRILAAEGRTVPDLAEFFMEAGPARNKRLLAGRFAQAQASGALIDMPPAFLAEVFLGLILGDLHLRRTLGLSEAPDDEAIEARVHAAATIFLNGVRKRDGGGAQEV